MLDKTAYCLPMCRIRYVVCQKIDQVLIRVSMVSIGLRKTINDNNLMLKSFARTQMLD